jgi:hypothetical protein
MSTPLVFVDCETDGVHSTRKPWEIAMIRRDERGERETSFFVEIDLSTADPFGLKVGRFYGRHPHGRFLSGATESYDPGDLSPMATPVAAEWVARWTHGAHLVGAVPNFDAEMLDRLLRDHRLILTWHYHLIDIEAMAVGYLAGLRAAAAGENGLDADLPSLPWDSDDLSRACGVEPPGEEERHTALGDARWAMRLYDAITRSGS